MRHYRITEKGIQEEEILSVEECILKGKLKSTGKEFEIRMDKKEFDDWRMKMKENKK